MESKNHRELIPTNFGLQSNMLKMFCLTCPALTGRFLIGNSFIWLLCPFDIPLMFWFLSTSYSLVLQNAPNLSSTFAAPVLEWAFLWRIRIPFIAEWCEKPSTGCHWFNLDYLISHFVIFQICHFPTILTLPHLYIQFFSSLSIFIHVCFKISRFALLLRVLGGNL